MNSIADHSVGGAVSIALNSSGSTLILEKRQWLVELSTEFRTYSQFSQSELLGINAGGYVIPEKRSALFGSIHVGFGLHEKLTFSIRQTYFGSEFNLVGDSISESNVNGETRLGDPTIMGNYLLFLNKKTGIGLSIVKKIVDLYEGTVWLESELNKGTTFYFTIKK